MTTVEKIVGEYQPAHQCPLCHTHVNDMTGMTWDQLLILVERYNDRSPFNALRAPMGARDVAR